jgi:hypothetical protein
MSKALKIIGTVAAVVALVATGVGIAGGGALFAGAGASTAAVAAATATITTVATVASVVSAAAMIGAVALQKPPPARGSVTQIIVSVDPPRPFVMGEGYVGGVIRHDVGYGATVNKVPNPYLWQVHVYSGVGPVQSITPQVDFGSVPSYYSTYLYTTTQLGLCPQSAALTPQWSGAPGWSTSSKLSGCAAIGWSARFDKDGKRFANGLPVFGAYGQWAKAYDPRKDSTRAGGSGSHRVTDPTTWEYTARPALLAGSYAYGYYQNGKLIMGMGLPDAAINWDYVADWANVCDDNSWTLFGRVFEPGGPEARWANLTDICIAGGGTPVFAGGQLSFHYSAPRVALGTITADDLADGTQRVTGQKSYAQRINTVIPRFIDSASNWEQVPAAPVVASTLVTEDGETRSEEYPYNLVKNKNQAAQLAMYRIYNAREITVPEVPLLPNYVGIRPGECWTFDLPDLGLDNQDCIVWSRSIDPGSFGVTLSLETETAAKHAFALGQTGTAPDTPTLARTGEQLDDITDAVMLRTDDIADAALTANWPDVTGTGRPTDYADVTAANTAAGITGQGDLATSNRATLAFGANAFVNSDMTATAAGWEFIGGTNGSGLTYGGGRNGVTGYFGKRNVAHAVYSSGSAIPNTVYMFGPGTKGFWAGAPADVKRYGLPVRSGDRVALAGKFALHGANTLYLRVRFWSETGSLLAEADSSWVIGDARYGGPTAGAGDPANFAERSTYQAAPSGSAYATWGCWTVSSGIDTTVYIFVTEPLLALTPATQTAAVIYSPGPAERAADATSENTAAAITGQAATATNSNYTAITGTKPPADADKTSLNTAASIAGQAATATNSDYTAVTGTKPPSDADKTSINTAAGIAGQAATATNSDYTAVTGTKPPADADKTSANTSANTSNVGTVPASAVQSTINTGGGVANNQVPTAAIVNNAVTVPVYAFTLAGVVISATTTIQTVSITTNGEPVKIDFSYMLSATTSSSIRLTRNGSDIIPTRTLGSNSGQILVSFSLGDSPGAGTHTYDLIVQASGTVPQAFLRSLFVMGIKK